MQQIEEEKRKEIINLYFNEEKSYVEISNITKIHRVTISQIINKYKKANNIDIVTKKVNFWKEKNRKKPRTDVAVPIEFLEDVGVNENNRNIKITVNKKTKKIILENSKKNKENK